MTAQSMGAPEATAIAEMPWIDAHRYWSTYLVAPARSWRIDDLAPAGARPEDDGIDGYLSGRSYDRWLLDGTIPNWAAMREHSATTLRAIMAINEACMEAIWPSER